MPETNYNKIFGKARDIKVKNISYNGSSYNVTLNKNFVDKVLSDRNLSPEKLAVIDNLDEVVSEGKYLGSGKYVPKGKKVKNTIRFDYFETDISINGKPYVVAFDVEVIPGKNNYRTHKVINEINLMALKDGEVGPAPTAFLKASGLNMGSIEPNNSISNNSENINGLNTEIENTSTYGENTVGSAQMNPNSTRAQLDNLAEQYGAIEDGESPRVRAANIPNSTDGETQVSKFARTLIETPNTPDILVPELENAVLKGKFSHEIITDKKAKSYAYDVIEKQGYEAAYQKWRNALNDHESGQKRIGKSDTALATALYNEACDAAAKGDTSAARVAMQIASDLVEVYTEAGQVVQSARLMKSMTPQGQLYSLQKLAERISSKRKAKGRSQGKDITINEEMAQELLQAETEAETETAVNKIKTDMAQQIGANLADVINEWRYFCMLANPKTHIRNIVGNGATQAMYSVKDVVGTALESLTDKVSRAKGGQGLHTRTKAVLNPLSRTDTELRNFAKNDFKINGKKFTDATSKYNENGDILSRRNVWKNNPVGEAIIKKVPAMEAVFNGIDKAAKFNTNMLDVEDTAFIKLNYTRVLAEYMKANDIDIIIGVNVILTKNINIARYIIEAVGANAPTAMVF